MKKQDFSLFPTEENAKCGVDFFQNYKWPDFNYESSIESHVNLITNKLGEFFNLIPDLLYVHNEETELPFNFFRARPLDTFTDTQLITEFKYTPINLTTKIQRCNFPYKPVFYCSNDVGTALMEVIKDQNTINERIYLISKWTKKENVKTKIVPFLYNKLPEENYFRLLGDKALSKIHDIFETNLTDSQVKGLKIYLQFLSSSFLTEDYSLSATLAHRILYATHNYRADMFIYPSVQANHRSINFAIHPNYVDSNLKLERIYSVKVTEIDKNRGEFKIGINKYAVIEEGHITWHSITPNDSIYQDSVRKDFNFESDFVFQYTPNAL